MTFAEALVERVTTARKVVVLTGAGISAPSGLATYRSGGSGWSDPDLEAKSHARVYGNHLATLWPWWDGLRRAFLAAEPNLAHLALAIWGNALRGTGGSLLVATQNVDGLHERAGSTTVPVHGSMHQGRCLTCRTVFPLDSTLFASPGAAPTCPGCGSTRTRPDIVLFGEQLPTAATRRVEQALLDADLLVAVGTSGRVHPAAGWVEAAREAGAWTALADLNEGDWEPWPFDTFLVGDAAKTLPYVLAQAGMMRLP